MKRKEYRRMEAIARELLNAPTAESIERMEKNKERAFQIYMQRQQAEEAAKQEKASRKQSAKRGLRPGLVTALAVALALLFVPMLMDMLFPVRDSIASEGWKRTLIIWVNDTFHTKIQVPESLHDEGGLADMKPAEIKEFTSLSEAAAFCNGKLLTIDEEKTGYKLKSVEIECVGEEIYRITQLFQKNQQSFSIVQKTSLDYLLSAPNAETTIVNCPVGDIVVWQGSDEVKGVIIADEWHVKLISNCPLEETSRVFATLQYIREHIPLQ